MNVPEGLAAGFLCLPGLGWHAVPELRGWRARLPPTPALLVECVRVCACVRARVRVHVHAPVCACVCTRFPHRLYSPVTA